MKAIQQYFRAVLFIMPYKLLTFDSMNENMPSEYLKSDQLSSDLMWSSFFFLVK